MQGVAYGELSLEEEEDRFRKLGLELSLSYNLKNKVHTTTEILSRNQSKIWSICLTQLHTACCCVSNSWGTGTEVDQL